MVDNIRHSSSTTTTTTTSSSQLEVREGFKNYDFIINASSDQDGEGSGSAMVFKEQDGLLPIANVGRIMKKILPPNAKISKEAKETMQECVSEFISFVTGEASDKCYKEKRKTVNGDDICWAMASLGFDDYSDPLKKYLLRFREVEGDHRSSTSASAHQQFGKGTNNNNIHNFDDDHDHEDQQKNDNLGTYGISQKRSKRLCKK